MQFDPIGRNRYDEEGCDLAITYLARAGVNYEKEQAPIGATPEVRIGDEVLIAPTPRRLAEAERAPAIAAFQAELRAALDRHGYPQAADDAAINKPMVVAILALLVIYVTMVYGPIAAMLVELFPARIRYTSMSLPYHIGNGWFGGFLPTTSFAIVAATGNIYYGLWYPIGIALMTLVIGLLFLPETYKRNIDT
ncbi:MAG: MFS transporter [Terricaulis sp.]|nr:MFS transporter [Terricaulis sp.]